MDENTSNAVFSLMQKVVDKLDAIIEKVTTEDEVELTDIITKNDSEIKDLLSKVVNNQAVINKTNLAVEEKVIDTIIKNKTLPVVKNYTEYCFLGSKSYFNPMTLFFMFFSLVVIWSSLKYLPPYFTERSLITKEREEYQLFYNYVYLKQLKNDKLITANKILKKVKKRDISFLKEYNTILRDYKREVRRQELREELNSLNTK